MDAFETRGLTLLGSATQFADDMHGLSQHARIIDDFSLDEIRRLAVFLDVYDAPGGTTIIEEGEVGDFMIFVISGMVEVIRRSWRGEEQRIALVGSGHALGEMSMVDGEPRFASCRAVGDTRIAILTRAKLEVMLDSEPRLGARILMKMVQTLSQRLRTTSAKLVSFLQVAP